MRVDPHDGIGALIKRPQRAPCPFLQVRRHFSAPEESRHQDPHAGTLILDSWPPEP